LNTELGHGSIRLPRLSRSSKGSEEGVTEKTC
jgi:hypothetical protein